jgi:hypothetical protein
MNMHLTYLKRFAFTFLSFFSSMLLMTALAQVPLKMINGLPYLEAKINGKGPFLFGLDTGFGGAVELDSALAMELGIKQTGNTEIGDPSGRNNLTLATGKINQLSIGGDSFKNLEVIFRPGRKILSASAGAVGILGMLFTAHSFTIDYPASQFLISSSPLPVADNKTIFSYTPVGGGVPEIEIRVGDTKLKAVVDSRSTSGVFKLPEALAKKFGFTSEPRLVGKGRKASNEINIYGGTLKSSISIGDYLFPDPQVTFPSFREDQGVIGAMILKDFAISIDQRNHRIRFEKKEIIPPAEDLKEYIGNYAERVISVSDGFLHVQRPGDMLLKMIRKSGDEFSLERVPAAILKFERDADGKIIALNVFNPQQNAWEKVERKG